MADVEAFGEWEAGWALLEAAEPEGYYEDTLKLLSMITLAGRWLTP